MERRSLQCSVSNKTERSNLTRHMKLHAPKAPKQIECGKRFTFIQQLSSHLKQRLYPHIPLHRQGEAKLLCSDAAKTVAKILILTRGMS